MNINNGVVLSFLAYTSYSIMDLVNKFFFANVEISAMNYMFWINIIMLFIIIVFHVSVNRANSLSILKLKHPQAILIRSILGAINVFASLVAISYLPFHIYYSIVFTEPIIVMLFSILFRLERPRSIQILVTMICVLGLSITLELHHSTVLHFNYNIIGIIAAFMVSGTGALIAIWVRLRLKNYNALNIVFYSVVFNIVFASILLFIKDKYLFIEFTFMSASLIILSGFFCALGFILFIKAYQTNTIVQAIAIAKYTEIVWGIIFGYFIFATIPSVSALIGACLLIGANIVNIKYTGNSIKSIHN